VEEISLAASVKAGETLTFEVACVVDRVASLVQRVRPSRFIL
jgi:hypothetical protein